MEQRLSPIKLDSYQPLREVVCESLREAIRKVTGQEALVVNVDMNIGLEVQIGRAHV